MDLIANTLLSAGASPAMLHSLEEIPDFTPRVKALSINIGTLSPSWLPAMKAAAELCFQLGIPWVLDPVAVSASSFRFDACLDLLRFKPAVIRGNASEIIALSNLSPPSSSQPTLTKVILIYAFLATISFFMKSVYVHFCFLNIFFNYSEN